MTSADATSGARVDLGRIAFARQGTGDAAQRSEIFLTLPTGLGEQRVTAPPAGLRDDSPDMSPTGNRIVLQRCGSGRDACFIASVLQAGSGLRRLSPRCRSSSASRCFDDRAPVYAPGSRRIAFVRSRVSAGPAATPKLVVADARLRHPHNVVTTAFRGRPYAVSWSPNGTKLAFAAANDSGPQARPQGGRALYVVGVNGRDLRRITPWALAAGDRPDWSPAGNRILFRSQSNRLGGVGADLYSVRPDGTGLRRLTEPLAGRRVFSGTYSPDGARIVFSASEDGTGGAPDLFVMRVDGTGLRRLTDSPSWELVPDWGTRR